MSWFWNTDADQLKERVDNLVNDFPRLQLNWVRFKIGVEKGLFSTADRARIIDVYARFPETWEAIRPNFVQNDAGTITPDRIALGQRVDAWVKKLQAEIGHYEGLSGLGVLPVLVVAGLWIAGALVGAGLATAAVIAALAWYKDADNEQQVIEQTTAGVIPPDVLKARYEAEASPGFFGEIGSLVKLGLGVAALTLAWPWIKQLITPSAEHEARQIG